MRRALGSASRLVVSLLAATWRVETWGREHPDALRRHGRPFVFALWHRHLLPLIWYHRGDRTLLVVSGHQDGGYLAQAAQGWGYGVIRGSSTRGGVGALRGMLKVLGSGGEVAITPDGPRGPAGMVKPGVVAAAQLAGAVIVPVAAGASAAWHLRSWDRFTIPKPGARVQIVYGAPLELPPEARRLEAARRLQHCLEAAGEQARC